MLDLKDKLNLLWKFLFLAVFAYGVISITCAVKCGSGCGKCSYSHGQVTQQCGSNCAKACCSKSLAPAKQCPAGCTKPCCKK